MKRPLLLAALCLLQCCARAATFQVGATRERKTLNAVVPQLKPGDVVEIDAGTYHETARLALSGTREKPILIRGVGAERATFDAENLDASGRGQIPRGVFQIEGAYITLEHLEFKNARNGQNAAGVRLLTSTNAVIRDCAVNHCDMGVFGDDRETALIENCDVGENGTPDFNGFSHNFYMSGNRVVVRHCWIHDALFGQNFKSRAHYNELWFNHIAGSNEGEVGFVDAKGHTDLPDSNALMVGNTVVSQPNRTGNAAKFVLFGSEMGPEDGGVHSGTLFLFNNTFIAGTARVRFITLDDPRAQLVAFNNAFFGSDAILNLARAGEVRAGGNWLPQGANLPNWSGIPAAPLRYVDGDGRAHELKLSE